MKMNSWTQNTLVFILVLPAFFNLIRWFWILVLVRVGFKHGAAVKRMRDTILSGAEEREDCAEQMILYTGNPGRGLAESAAQDWSHCGCTQRTAPQSHLSQPLTLPGSCLPNHLQFTFHLSEKIKGRENAIRLNYSILIWKGTLSHDCHAMVSSSVLLNNCGEFDPITSTLTTWKRDAHRLALAKLTRTHMHTSVILNLSVICTLQSMAAHSYLKLSRTRLCNNNRY